MNRALWIIPGLLMIIRGVISGGHIKPITPPPFHPAPIEHPERLVNKHFAKIYYPPSGLGAPPPYIPFHDATPLNSPEKFNDYGFFSGTHYQTLAKIFYWSVKIWHFIIIVMQPFAFLAFNLAGVNYLREGINRYLSLVSPHIVVGSLRQILENEGYLDPNGLDLSRLAEAKVDDRCLERMVCQSGLASKSMVPPMILRILDNLKLLPAKYSKLASIYWDSAVGHESTCDYYVCEADADSDSQAVGTLTKDSENPKSPEPETLKFSTDSNIDPDADAAESDLSSNEIVK